jgi:hypothetical protein
VEVQKVKSCKLCKWWIAEGEPCLKGKLSVPGCQMFMPPDRPRVVCLCGSTRFRKWFEEADLRETLAGKIVLSIVCDTEAFGEMSVDELTAIELQLDELHLRKIDIADEVLVLDIDSYIGESTHREIMYATERGKPIRLFSIVYGMQCKEEKGERV